MTDESRLNEAQIARRGRTIGTMSLIRLAELSAVVWSVGLVIVLLIVGLGYAVEVLLLAFAGLLFAILLRSIAELLTKVGLAEKWSVAVSILLVVGFVSASGALLAPRIAEQSRQLQRSVPKAVESLKQTLNEYEVGDSLTSRLPAPADLLRQRPSLFGRITGVISGTFQTVGVLVVIFFTGIYFAVQPRMYIEGIIKLVKIGRRDDAREILGEIGSALRWWLIGKLIAMLVVGFLTWVGLWMLGVDLALTLAATAAILTFIPNFGPIIAAVPAVLLGLLNSPMTAVWVIALYISVQTVESYLITPLIQQQAVSLPPALTISTQLAMAVFVGGIGLALASPLTVVVLILVQKLYVRDMLGDRTATSAGQA